MMGCNRMMVLEQICVILLILFMTLIDCKTYPPSVEEGCYCDCIYYWVNSREDVPTPAVGQMCRDGLIPDFHCDLKDEYDRALDKTPFLEFPDCAPEL